MNEEFFYLTEKKAYKKSFLFFIFFIVIFLGMTGYFFHRYKKTSKNPMVVQATVQKEAQNLTKDIGKLMLLPNDETPTIATITDINKLKDQLFFKDAKNGNKVLIYPNSKLAIIYDQEANMVINVGPINFSQQEAEKIKKARIILRNGTNVAGLTYKIEADIKKYFPDFEVVLKDQDKRTDYEKTKIVILNDEFKYVAAEIAKILNCQVENLPKGEDKPTDADILMIIGKDKS